MITTKCWMTDEGPGAPGFTFSGTLAVADV
jgi:hypothetical protein